MENKTAFTPGPWVIGGAYGETIKATIGQATNCVEFTLRGDSPVTILELQKADCVIACQPWIQFESAQWAEMQKANARLIAASPTMHEYIKKQAEKGDADAAKIIAEI